MEAIANIRKARELLRAEVKKNLKFPRILGFKKLVDCSPTLREQEVKLDRRYFHNIFKLEEKLGIFVVMKARALVVVSTDAQRSNRETTTQSKSYRGMPSSSGSSNRPTKL